MGNTPLVEISGVKVKLEYYNPSGSIKDRMAKRIIEVSERKRLLRKGMEIYEATTGNTGIAFSLISSIKGYNFTAVMPRSMSVERRKMIEAFGGKVVLVETVEEGMKLIEEISKKKKIFVPKQFENEENPKAYEKLAYEIMEEVKKIDHFVAGIGTGGTIIGVGRVLKEYFPKLKLIGILPKEKNHGIQGIGDGFFPEIVKRNQKLIDRIMRVSTADAIRETKWLWKHGFFAGISSGANFFVSKKLRNSVTVFPDRGDRYLSVLN